MDTIDRSDSHLPAKCPTPLSSQPALIPAFPSDLSPTSGPQINSKVILRGLSRHWWRILLLSLVVCTPISYLIWEFVEPTYEAFSVLRIEPTTPEIYGSLKTGFVATENVGPYLESQLIVIASDQVLEEVVANPLVNKFPLITKSKDPKTDLRKQIGVEIMEGAYMVRVALELPDANEAAVIVNAVVETYMRQNNAFNRGKNMSLQKSLHDSSEELTKQIKEKRRAGQDGPGRQSRVCQAGAQPQRFEKRRRPNSNDSADIQAHHRRPIPADDRRAVSDRSRIGRNSVYA